MENKILLIEPWSNAACMGYAISALENLGCKYDYIRQFAAEMRELFDWVSVDEAKEYFNGSPY